MKYKIFNEEKTEIKEVYFKLVYSDGVDSNIISLVVCNAEGEELEDGCILDIDKNGGFYVVSGVNEDFGFELNKDGEIIIN